MPQLALESSPSHRKCTTILVHEQYQVEMNVKYGYKLSLWAKHSQTLDFIVADLIEHSNIVVKQLKKEGWNFGLNPWLIILKTNNRIKASAANVANFPSAFRFPKLSAKPPWYPNRQKKHLRGDFDYTHGTFSNKVAFILFPVILESLKFEIYGFSENVPNSTTKKKCSEQPQRILLST